MLGNNGKQNLAVQIRQFLNDIRSSGKTPQELYDEVISSGKYSKEQIENARRMAERFQKIK